MSTTQQILDAMQANGIVDNRTNIVAALDHVGADLQVGWDLAAACAMVVNESGGRNIWGADGWQPFQYPLGQALPLWLEEQPVTQANYTYYKVRRNDGLQPQGCGPAQLTSQNLQIEAERLGGCWRPLPNLIVGFEFLKNLFVSGGSALAGFGAYNGSGPNGAYARNAVALQAKFQASFNA